LKSVADAICIITIGMLSGSRFAFMALGAGLRQDGGSSERRLRLLGYGA
jgi:hypothetical protein